MALPADGRVHGPRRASEADGGDVRYSVTDTTVQDHEGQPKVWFTDADGQEFEIQADFLVGADGSRSYCRRQVPEASRIQYFHEYPFAWFGILAEAPRSADELIYANSANGFALISQRTETVQRMYFQCDASENVAEWDDERIWSEFRKRVNGNGFPPTGAKGLNLAIHDVKVLFEGFDSYYSNGSTALLDSYSDRALERVWKAQHFSYWMTSMLHTVPGADEFDRARQLGGCTP